MSNYQVAPHNPKDEVLVGWDPMLNTFFAHVIDQTKDEDDEDRDVLWIGTTFNEIHDLDELLDGLHEYAIVSEEMLRQLHRDANT